MQGWWFPFWCVFITLSPTCRNSHFIEITIFQKLWSHLFRCNQEIVWDCSYADQEHNQNWKTKRNELQKATCKTHAGWSDLLQPVLWNSQDGKYLFCTCWDNLSISILVQCNIYLFRNEVEYNEISKIAFFPFECHKFKSTLIKYLVNNQGVEHQTLGTWSSF